MTVAFLQNTYFKNEFLFALFVSLMLHLILLIVLIFLKIPTGANETSPVLRYSLLQENPLIQLSNVRQQAESSPSLPVANATPAQVITETAQPSSAVGFLQPDNAAAPNPQQPVSQSSDQRTTLNPDQDSSSGTSKDQVIQSTSTRISDAALITEFLENQQGDDRESSAEYTSSAVSRTPAGQRYIQAFTREVQRIGQLNYPKDAASKNLHGGLTLEIAINANGSLASVSIASTSGHEELDSAAIRIIELAAPYAPLPQNLRNQKNQLEFVQSWSFRGRSLFND